MVQLSLSASGGSLGVGKRSADLEGRFPKYYPRHMSPARAHRVAKTSREWRLIIKAFGFKILAEGRTAKTSNGVTFTYRWNRVWQVVGFVEQLQAALLDGLTEDLYDL